MVELGPERVSLSAGGGCWIADDGSAECWDGDDEWSQDGNFVQISAGPLFACGVTSDSSVRCWSKEHGEGFYQSWWDTKEEIAVPEGTPVKQVEVDGPHLCAVHSDGTLGCYGREYHGIRLPVEGWEDPEPGPLPLVTFTQISTGGWRDGDSAGMSCGIRSDTSTLACWNDSNEHMLDAPDGQFTQVAAGDYHTCGLRVDGTAACWGWNRFGQSTPPEGRFTQIVSTMHMSCGLRPDGSVECWGYAGEQ